MQILEQLRSNLLRRVSLLHKLIDNFALMDMLNAFSATIASSNGDFVRPDITLNGPIAIQQASP